MTIDKQALDKLAAELQAAVALIERRQNISGSQLAVANSATNDFAVPKSLLEQCEAVISSTVQKKPTLRLIHHFACSGGTLFSKCLAAQPNVFVLSEVHPFSTLHLREKAQYLPSDTTTQARYSNFPLVEQLASKLFLSNIQLTEQHVSSLGGALVLRVHNHADYCVGAQAQQIERVSALLAEHFELLQVVTVRDPIDAYRSLQENGWLHFDPNTFEEYCQRFLNFLNDLQDIPLFRYEDFTQQPEDVMQQITGVLALGYDASFMDSYELFNLSGDSGRSSGTISPRSRKAISEDLQKQIEQSATYRKIAQQLNYSTEW